MSEREIIAEDLNLALEDLRRQGFRLDLIYPADDPHSAVLTRAGESVRLTTRPGVLPPPAQLPPFRPEFVVARAGGGAGEGRAGMLYRDLIPSRLGGRYIASHITIPEGGPVSDWVHYHRIALQMIAVRRGWVRVVYEDQGPPFVLAAGDMVLQPPEIRHRVLESSPGLEVIEITCPAVHETFADHELNLPNDRLDRSRMFGGQRFLHHLAKSAPWVPFNGGRAQETAMREATGGLVDARTIRSADGSGIVFPAHDGELVFAFVLEGSARLECSGAHALAPAVSFVIPPAEAWSIQQPSAAFRLLHVTTARMDEKA